MAANTVPIFPKTPQNAAITFVPADGTTKKTLVTAGADGARFDLAAAVNTSVSDVSFNMYANDGANDYPLGVFTVAAYAGTSSGGPATKVLDPTIFPWLDASGAMWLKTGWSVKVAPTSAMTTGQVSFVSFSGDY